jgi:UDP-glucose 4-epimerase
MKYTVTGGLGFIGNSLVNYLLNSGHDVQIIDNLSNVNNSKHDSLENTATLHKIDILNSEKLESLIEGQDGIFHHAALIDVQESFRNKDLYHRVNVLGTQNIFEVAKKFNLKVVYASSAAVYGNCPSSPIKEKDLLNPINPYGQTKMECEKIAENFAKKGVKSIGLRYFNVFGPCQSSAYAGVITKFFEKLLQGKSPEIFGMGDQIRDFVFVDDVAEANLKAMNSNIDFSIINVASGKPTKIIDLAQFMIESFGFNFKPSFLSALEGDIQESLADITLASKLLNWEPKTELEDWVTLQAKKYQAKK